jgi:hypothetical protein
MLHSFEPITISLKYYLNVNHTIAWLDIRNLSWEFSYQALTCWYWFIVLDGSSLHDKENYNIEEFLTVYFLIEKAKFFYYLKTIR